MKLLILAAAILALNAGSALAGDMEVTRGPVDPASSSAAFACGTQFGTDEQAGVASDTFAAADGMDEFDSYGAADFTVTQKCTITQVDVKGQYFPGPGPAMSVDVTFYKNLNGRPGRAVKAYTGLPYTDSRGTGSFAIPIPRTILKPGGYWISVSAEIDYNVGGRWLWELQVEQPGFAAMFKEAGGYGTGCLDWAPLTQCAKTGGDFMFVLRGKGH